MLTFLMIGAHPDDMDLKASGLAMKLSAKGHRAVFLSVTNGNAGHMSMEKEELRRRRLREIENASAVFGVPYDTLDIDDGYLTADIPTREKLMRYIRRIQPDVIITHRSCDYHPDHRACGFHPDDCPGRCCAGRTNPYNPGHCRDRDFHPDGGSYHGHLAAVAATWRYVPRWRHRA